jgi:lipoprotein signal peptidase
MSIKKIILWTVILIAIDQLIKVLIYSYFFNVRFEIIPSLLEFYPKFNIQYSYINALLNSHFGINIGHVWHIIYVLIIQVVLICIYIYFRKKNHTKLLDFSLIFFESGIISAFISYFFKEGCLDYIYFKPLFIFDLKDLYLNCFRVLFFIYFLKTLLNKKI